MVLQPHQWNAELKRSLRLEEIDVQMLEVRLLACFRIESTPPTRSESATSATERRSASSMSCAALLFLLKLGTTLSIIISIILPAII